MSYNNNNHKFKVRAKKTDIDTGRNPVIFLNKYCPIVAREGFEGMTRVRICAGANSTIATLNIINSCFIMPEEVGLCDKAFKQLSVEEGDYLEITHMEPITSFSAVRAKMFGNAFSKENMFAIIQDIVRGKYADTHIAAFCTACEGRNMNEEEIVNLTEAMVETGDKVSWGYKLIVDKHCIGGIPNNRTTPIVIAIIAHFGMHIPKTSSRAITSPAGTADTMEVLTTVDLSLDDMKRIVNEENGCLVWGGSVSLSPSDDALIKVKRDLDIDSEGQMISSIVSKKIAAGSTHVLIDIPVGKTAKVRSKQDAKRLQKQFEKIGKKLGIDIKVIITDGSQPVGSGIGPALEARDVVAILKNEEGAPQDLKNKSLKLAGMILEFSSKVKAGEGRKLAQEILESGKAWKKFKSICESQGGMKSIPYSAHTEDILSEKAGKVVSIDNRKLAYAAKIAGAPEAKSAGIYLHKHIGDEVKKDEKIMTIHSEAEGELKLTLGFLDKFKILEIE